jgi:hypothetical protein
MTSQARERRARTNETSSLRSLRRAARWCAAGALAFLVVPCSHAQSAPSVGQVLDLASKFVERSAEHFGKVVCVETVSQNKLNPDGKVLVKQDSTLDYQVQVDVQGNTLLVHESATPQSPPAKSKHVPLLVTEGFSTLLLIFHPMFQSDFEFALVPGNGDSAPGVVAVHFQHVHGSPSPSVLRLRGQDYPLDLQGTAWLDEATGAIERIETDLAAPMNDVGLAVFHSDVSYMPTHFTGNPQTYWLPIMAEMDAESPHQHWQNFYRFTNYRMFSATMEIEFSKKP